MFTGLLQFFKKCIFHRDEKIFLCNRSNPPKTCQPDSRSSRHKEAQTPFLFSSSTLFDTVFGCVLVASDRVFQDRLQSRRDCGPKPNGWPALGSTLGKN